MHSSFLFATIVSSLALLDSSVVYSQVTIETDDPLLTEFIIVPDHNGVYTQFVTDPDSWTDFPTPPPVVTTAPTPWPTMAPTPAPPQNYILFESGDASDCPAGTSRVSQGQCLDAAQYLRNAQMGSEYSFPYYLNTNPDYGAPPCGCFLRVKEGQGQILPEYNTATTGCQSGTRTRLICELDAPLPPNTAVDMTQWQKVYASGSLQYDDPTAIIDPTAWSYANLAAGDFYVRRLCQDCSAESHQDIIYHRKTPLPVGMNLEDLFVKSWTSTGNQFHTDFELYSNMPYALLQVLPWQFCNFAVELDASPGFPRDCGKSGNVTHQWNALSNGEVGATLYHDDNFAGVTIPFTAGDYDFAEFTGNGAGNDQVSSLQVNPGYTATLYEHAGFRGWAATFGPGDYTAADIVAAGGADNGATALKVHPDPNSNSTGNGGVLNYAFYVWGGTFSGGVEPSADIETCRNEEECSSDPSRPYYMALSGNNTCLDSLMAQTEWNQGVRCGVAPDWSVLLEPCYNFEACIGQQGPYHLSFIDQAGLRKEKCFDWENGKNKAAKEGTYCASSACTQCDNRATAWMTNNGISCDTTDNMLQYKCSIDEFWSSNKYCQESCFVEGYGYDGDNCCTEPIVSGGRLLIPLYVYPENDINDGSCTSAQYQKVANYSAGGTTIIAIVNPSNGPNYDTVATKNAYDSCIALLKENGVEVIGYIHTKVGSYPNISGYRNMTEIKGDIDMWRNQYTVDGIFIDEVTNRWPAAFDSKELAVSTYTEIVDYILAIPEYGRAVMNPGSVYYEELMMPYYGNPQVIAVVYEGTTEAYYPPSSGKTCLELLLHNDTQEGLSFDSGPFCPYVPIGDQVESLQTAMTTPSGITAEQSAVMIYDNNMGLLLAAAVADIISITASQNIGWYYYYNRAADWSDLPIYSVWNAQTDSSLPSGNV